MSTETAVIGVLPLDVAANNVSECACFTKANDLCNDHRPLPTL